VIKVEAFPFTRYGSIPGKVTHVARDSVPAADALRSEGDPTQAPAASGTFRPAQQTQNLVYSVIVQPAQNFIHADGIDQPLSSGMTVTAEIRTGKRRILEYIFSPLVEIAATAMTER
jgi:hemolysin D